MKLRAFLFFAALVAHVEAGAEGHAVGAKIGMLGLGIEYAYPLSERLVIRGGVHSSGYSFDQTESGIDYEFDVNWDSISAALDFHPTKGAWRITAGLLKNDNGLSMQSNLSDDVSVGGTTYTPAEVGTLRGDIGFDDNIAPFLGLGWDWSRTKRFGLTFDFGVVKQGMPTISLSADGGLIGDPAFEADLAAEEAELQEALDDLDLVPFATVGLVFRF